MLERTPSIVTQIDRPSATLNEQVLFRVARGLPSWVMYLDIGTRSEDDWLCHHTQRVKYVPAGKLFNVMLT